MPVEEPRKRPLRAVEPALEPPPEWLDMFPWADTRTFYVHSKSADGKGMTTRAEVRVSIEWLEKMLEIVQSGRFPQLKTTSDCMRDAIWRWLRLMADTTEDAAAKKDLERQRRQSKIKALQTKRTELRTMIEEAASILDDDGDPQAQREVLKELSAQVLEMEEGSDLREKVIKLIAKHHGK